MDKNNLFGVGATPEANTQAEPQTQSIDEQESVESSSFLGGFEEHSQMSEFGGKQQTFGVDADQNQTISSPNFIIGFLKEIFLSQDKKFWFAVYILAIIFYFYQKDTSLLMQKLATSNVILYPFALILLSNLALRLTKKRGTIFYFLSPTFERSLNVDGFVRSLIWFGAKLFVFSYVWTFSTVLGLISLMMMALDYHRKK